MKKEEFEQELDKTCNCSGLIKKMIERINVFIQP